MKHLFKFENEFFLFVVAMNRKKNHPVAFCVIHTNCILCNKMHIKCLCSFIESYKGFHILVHGVYASVQLNHAKLLHRNLKGRIGL